MACSTDTPSTYRCDWRSRDRRPDHKSKIRTVDAAPVAVMPRFSGIWLEETKSPQTGLLVCGGERQLVSRATGMKCAVLALVCKGRLS